MFRYRSLKVNEGNGSSTLLDLSKTFAQNVVIAIPKKKKKNPYRSGKKKFLKQNILIFLDTKLKKRKILL